MGRSMIVLSALRGALGGCILYSAWSGLGCKCIELSIRHHFLVGAASVLILYRHISLLLKQIAEEWVQLYCLLILKCSSTPNISAKNCDMVRAE